MILNLALRLRKKVFFGGGGGAHFIPKRRDGAEHGLPKKNGMEGGGGGLYSWSNIVVLNVVVASLLTTHMELTKKTTSIPELFVAFQIRFPIQTVLSSILCFKFLYII